MLQNQVDRIRLGITVSRKVGKACVRNRIKRRLREYFRLNRDKMPAGMDLVFVATKAAASLETGRIQEELDRFFESGH
jgi:ribonuclease P protein component